MINASDEIEEWREEHLSEFRIINTSLKATTTRNFEQDHKNSAISLCEKMSIQDRQTNQSQCLSA